MKKSREDFREELCAYVLHPDRLLKISEKYNINFSDILKIY